MKLRRSRCTFADRRDAGKAVAQALGEFASTDCLVLGLARGGVPVAHEVAATLGAGLDVLVVRKLGVPQWSELAMGALATGGVVVYNDNLISRLGITSGQVAEVVARETAELARREGAYRGRRPPLAPAGKTVILVDDGIATGASMIAACGAVRAAGAARIVIAVPVGPPSAGRELASHADAVVVVAQPPSFSAVGEVYADFTQVGDDEVRRLLAD